MALQESDPYSGRKRDCRGKKLDWFIILPQRDGQCTIDTADSRPASWGNTGERAEYLGNRCVVKVYPVALSLRLVMRSLNLAVETASTANIRERNGPCIYRSGSGDAA